MQSSEEPHEEGLGPTGSGEAPASGGAPRRSLLPSVFQDPLIRYVTVNLLLGMAFGAAFAALVLWFDVSGLSHLILGSSSPAPALVLLFGSFMLTFGSLVCGTAIMLLPSDDDPPPPRGGKKQKTALRLAEARVVVRKPRR